MRAGAWQELDRRENVAFRARGQTQTFPVGRPAACRCAPRRPARQACVRPVTTGPPRSIAHGQGCAALARAHGGPPWRQGRRHAERAAVTGSARRRQGVQAGGGLRARALVGQLGAAGRAGPAPGLAGRAGRGRSSGCRRGRRPFAATRRAGAPAALPRVRPGAGRARALPRPAAPASAAARRPAPALAVRACGGAPRRAPGRLVLGTDGAPGVPAGGARGGGGSARRPARGRPQPAVRT